MKLLEAFVLGWTPAAIGYRFNALELLAKFRAATGALRETVDRHARAIGERSAETVAGVLAVEQLLRAGKQLPPARPQTYADYQKWAQVSAEAGRRAVRTSMHEQAAHVLGLTCGDLALTLELRVLVDELTALAPAEPLLAAQASVLAESQERAASRLALLADDPALPDVTRTLVATLEPIVRAQPPLEAFRHVGVSRKFVEKSLAEP